MAHFIPLTDGEKGATVPVKVSKEVWRFDYLPSNIVSDRNSRFTSTFWSSVVVALDVVLKMASSFCPQMDRQTRGIKQPLECYLQNYCNYVQDNWSEMLPMAVYA
jgi:hypothetical protein